MVKTSQWPLLLMVVVCVLVVFGITAALSDGVLRVVLLIIEAMAVVFVGAVFLHQKNTANPRKEAPKQKSAPEEKQKSAPEAPKQKSALEATDDSAEHEEHEEEKDEDTTHGAGDSGFFFLYALTACREQCLPPPKKVKQINPLKKEQVNTYLLYSSHGSRALKQLTIHVFQTQTKKS